MAKHYDATIKQLVEAHPADWLKFAGLPVGAKLGVVDSDISAISPAVDKVIRVSGDIPYIAHFEFQSSADPELDRRVLFYNVLLRRRHELPVRSVAILLRPEANSPRVLGKIHDSVEPDIRLEFGYRIIRAWELSAESLLSGGLGTLPLVPLGNVARGELAGVLDNMQDRLAPGTSSAEQADAWTATFILMGLRYPAEVGLQLLKGIRNMEDSTTYQWLVEQGAAKGEAQGRLREARSILLRIGRRRLGPPPSDVLATLEAVDDLPRIESLAERVMDVSSWTELLKVQV